MKSAELKMLGNVFAAEVQNRLPFQSKAAMIKRLAAKGFVEPMTLTIPPAFTVKVTGWTLTQLGRLTYCKSCE